jgi:hypothetical protein
MNERRWWLPSMSAGIWLMFFLFLCFFDWPLVLISVDGDTFWHWLLCIWMIQHHTIISHDPFSHTRAGDSIVSKEWLSDVLFAAAGNALGWNGVVCVAALLIATTLALLHRQLLAEGSEILLSTLLVLLAAAACTNHWLARPHLFTLLLVVIFASQLRSFDRDRVPPRQLFAWLVPLTVLWTNLHGGFLSGLILVSIHFLGNAVRWIKGDSAARRRVVTLAMLGMACALATFINPNGWKLHEHILDFLRTPYQAYFTNEWKSANFHSAGMHGLLLQLLVLGLLLVALRRSLSGTDLLLIAFWLYSGLQAVRNVPIFALIVTPIFAEHLSAALSDAQHLPWTGPFRRVSGDVIALSRAAGRGSLPFVAVVVMLMIFAKPKLVGGHAWVETEVLTNRFPAASVEYLRAHPGVVNGEMFNDYGWGGYLILYLPERKVFIDGRNDFYGEALLREFTDVNRLTPAWEKVLAKYHVGWTILPRVHPLNQLLALRTDWRLVYVDDVAAIYTQRPP